MIHSKYVIIEIVHLLVTDIDTPNWVPLLAHLLTQNVLTIMLTVDK